MEVIINGSKSKVDTGAKLAEVIQTLNLTATTGIAIAINDTVVPKNQWMDFTLNNNDEVLIIKATQGG